MICPKASSARSRRPSPAPLYWDQYARKIKKAMFHESIARHKKDIHLKLVRTWSPGLEGKYILKTDSYEEAFGQDAFLDALSATARLAIGMDISVEIAGMAKRRFPMLDYTAGGVRVREDVTAEELRLLASHMTLKYGFLGIPQGGAKAGITFDPDAPEETRRRVLFRFGQEISPLLRSRAFIPGPDMGTTPDDIRSLFEGAGRKPSKIKFSDEGSGYYSGSSVFVGAETALAARGKSLRGATVAIEGFGKVGTAAARLFFLNGARVVAVSTKEGALFHDKGLPVPELIEAVKARGPSFVRDFPSAGRISGKDLLTLDVDVLCPCALSHSIRSGNAESVRAGIISSGANAPLTPEAIARLHSRSVLVLPDFIANSGGTLGIFLEIGGFRSAETARLIPELIAPRIRELIRASDVRGIPPHTLAVKAVLDRFTRLKEKAEGRSAGGRILRHTTVRSLRRLMPRSIARRMGLAYFRHNLAGPMFEEAESRLNGAGLK